MQRGLHRTTGASWAIDYDWTYSSHTSRSICSRRKAKVVKRPNESGSNFWSRKLARDRLEQLTAGIRSLKKNLITRVNSRINSCSRGYVLSILKSRGLPRRYSSRHRLKLSHLRWQANAKSNLISTVVSSIQSSMLCLPRNKVSRHHLNQSSNFQS